MKKKLRLVYLSAVDENRFNIRVARAPDVSLKNISTVMDFCRSHDVKFLIARCNATELNCAQEMEKKGFYLMDTLSYYSCDLIQKSIPDDTEDTLIRPIKPGEELIIKNIAKESFKGYFGHYHADPKLDRSKCDETYTSWAYDSCTSSELSDEVLVAELEQSIVGFATMRINTVKEGEGVLFGVAPNAQGKGIYRSLILSGMNWCKTRNTEQMVVSTQITNIAVQKVWVRVGFEPNRHYYTFHKWFE